MPNSPSRPLRQESGGESLRLVSSSIGDHAAESETAIRHGGEEVAHLPRTLLRAYAEISEILARLRESRSILEQSAIERLAGMNAKLREVSSATEIAATDILNGLDRTVAMVDELDALGEETGTKVRAAGLRSAMREELFGLMVHLQFQDITTQQLAYASSVISETEQRLSRMVSLFEPGEQGDADAPPREFVTATQFDPDATTANAAARQALADEIFTGE